MREVRDQIAPTLSRRAAYVRTLEQARIMPEGFIRLENLVESVRLGATQVGTLPSVPNTLRGRIGSILVAVVHRCLFWYTPQLHAYHLKLAAALEEQAMATQALLEELRQLRAQITELKSTGELQDPPQDQSLPPSTPKESGWRK